jgi:hypothetical protein
MAAAYWIANGVAVAEAIKRVRARPTAVETAYQEAVLHRFAACVATA